MKRVFAFAVAIVFASSTPAAGAPRPQIAVKAGVVNSSLFLFGSSSGVVDVGSSGETGFAIGVSARLARGPGFSLQPELLLTEKAGSVRATARLTHPVSGLEFARSRRLQVSVLYLQLPLLVRYDLGGERTRPFFFAHAVAGFKLGASTKTDIDLQELGLTESELADQVASTQLALGGGAGLELGDPNASVWSFELRIELALTQLFAHAPDGELGVLQSSEKLQSGMLLVGYRF